MTDVSTRGSALEEFEQQLAARSLSGHWQMDWRDAEGLSPVVWKWSHITEALDRAAELIEIGGADDTNDRRTIHLVNPNASDVRRTSGIIQVAIQYVKPGEKAEAHRHSQNALRFVVDTAGEVFTTVDCEKMLMEAGDLVLTPNWTWHDHTNASSRHAIWLDILDVNLTRHMGGHFKEVWPDGPMQPVLHEDGYSQKRFGTIRPRTAGTLGYAIPYSYKWSDARPILNELARAGEVDAHEGILLEYAHPRTGGPTFTTMNCRMQMLPARSKTRALRRTGITFYHVFGGNGATVVGPGSGGFGHDHRTPSNARTTETLRWAKDDCFMVPGWRWQEHENLSDEPVFLFSVTEQPGLEALGWYREERA